VGAVVSMARDGEDDRRIMAQSQSQAGGSSAAGMVAEDPHSLAGRANNEQSSDRHSALPATARRGHGIGRKT